MGGIPEPVQPDEGVLVLCLSWNKLDVVCLLVQLHSVVPLLDGLDCRVTAVLVIVYHE